MCPCDIGKITVYDKIFKINKYEKENTESEKR